MPRPVLRPYWTTNDRRMVRLYQGDVIEVLNKLPRKSVQMVVTSPPYWGLRNYGTDKTLEIGSEKTLDKYVEKMVEVFRAVWEVLRDDGVVWLNLGDSYATSPKGSLRGQDKSSLTSTKTQQNSPVKGIDKSKVGLPSGNLVGIPWRVALALQADGWVLRQDIVWHKPSPMPESVRNRCTKTHEYLFILTKKGSGYYYDAEAIKEKSLWSKDTRSGKGRIAYTKKRRGKLGTGQEAFVQVTNTRNKRSVWTVATESYAGAHFATFPRKLITPCVLAGTSAHGACAECGAPWKRVVEVEKLTRKRPNDYVKRTGEKGTGNSCANTVAGVDVTTVGWKPSCKCSGLEIIDEQPKKPAQKKEESDVEYELRLKGQWMMLMRRWYVDWEKLWPEYQEVEVVPCVVLDPFVGSGTTNCVSVVNGRRSIGIDLSEEYLQNNAIPRIEGVMLGIPNLARLVAKPSKGIELGERIG